MIAKILNTIPDFKESIENEHIKVCLLRPYSKISTKGWASFVDPAMMDSYLDEEYNLGISLIGEEYPGQPILTCIDIDGDKRELNGIPIEQFTKDWMFNILTNEFNNRDIKYMAVQSSSGGYHIYVYCQYESVRYKSTTNLMYPNNPMKNLEDDSIQMFLSASKMFSDQIAGEEVPKGIIEVWCKKRYMVAPGSIIEDPKTGEKSEVKLLPHGVQRFSDIGLVKEDLNDLIRTILIDNNFISDEQESNPYEKVKREYHPNDLPKRNIEILTELLLEWLPKIPGQKHTFCLALGGYFYHTQVSLGSVKEIAYKVVQKSNGLFDNNEAFIDTLTHDIRTKDKSRQLSGLPTVEEILEPYYQREIIGRQLHLLTNPTYHKFWPEGRYSQQYQEVFIDYKNHYMVNGRMRTKISKEGEISEVMMSNSRILNNIDYFEYINDVSDLHEHDKFEKPVKVVYTTPLKTQHEYIFQNSNDLVENYKKIQGSHGDHSKIIVSSILNEFEALNLIQTKESSTRPGIWYSETENKLVKYIEDKNNIIKIDPHKPSKRHLLDSLRILKRINDIYPWKPGKFGLFIRLALTLPYTNVLKYKFNLQHPSIFLYGEAGTLKSTAGELAIYLNGDFSANFKNYLVSGGEMNSEYRFGKIMDASSFPLVVDEPEQLFSSPRTRELIKSSAFGKLIREPGGQNPKPYYSRRGSIYTINALPTAAEDPSFLRRFITIGFDRDERGDTPEVIEKLKYLNDNGHNNYKFKKLQTIGNYIFNILNEHQDWLLQPLDTLQNNIIMDMENYTGYDLTFLKEVTKEHLYTDRTEYESNTLTSILKVLKKPYLYSKNKYIQKLTDTQLVKTIIENNSEYSYINFIKQKNTDKQYILIDIGFKDAYNAYYMNEGKTVTLQNVLNYLSDLDLEFDCLRMTPAYIEGRKKQTRGIKMSLEDFTRILTGKQDIT